MTSETDACTTVTVAEARERLDELLSRVADGRERIVIERDGQPAAVLAPIDQPAQRGDGIGQGNERAGLLGLQGLFGGIMDDDEIDETVADIYAARERDIPRAFDLDI